jgi:hypothetical protein
MSDSAPKSMTKYWQRYARGAFFARGAKSTIVIDGRTNLELHKEDVQCAVRAIQPKTTGQARPDNIEIHIGELI